VGRPARDRPGAGDAPDLDPGWVDRVRAKLVAWYEGAARDLPWRADRDPYRILVAETMLVQTTVAAVVPYYERFLARFPTVAALAKADEAEVVKAWEGLGYYRRARQLHAAAKAVVLGHGGVIPDDPDAVRALPGVGPYIAGAVLSFAFDRPAAIVEANTQRVLARWLAWRGDPRSSATRARLWEAAGRLVPSEGAGRFNQAFIELGALVCTPKAPGCLVCPVAGECRARALGLQDVVPAASRKPPPLAAAEASALVFRGGRVLVVGRGPGGLWEGFWEFPTVHVSGADPAGRLAAVGPVDLAEGVRRLTGVRAEIGRVVLTVNYGVTRHRVRLDAHEARGLSEPIEPGPGVARAAWERPENLANYPFSSAGRRLVGWVVRHAPGGDPTGRPGA
jgi:A/G-specific adenine glycosylase